MKTIIETSLCLLYLAAFVGVTIYCAARLVLP